MYGNAPNRRATGSQRVLVRNPMPEVSQANVELRASSTPIRSTSPTMLAANKPATPTKMRSATRADNHARSLRATTALDCRSVTATSLKVAPRLVCWLNRLAIDVDGRQLLFVFADDLLRQRCVEQVLAV